MSTLDQLYARPTNAAHKPRSTTPGRCCRPRRSNCCSSIRRRASSTCAPAPNSTGSAARSSATASTCTSNGRATRAACRTPNSSTLKAALPADTPILFLCRSAAREARRGRLHAGRLHEGLRPARRLRGREGRRRPPQDGRRLVLPETAVDRRLTARRARRLRQPIVEPGDDMPMTGRVARPVVCAADRGAAQARGVSGSTTSPPSRCTPSRSFTYAAATLPAHPSRRGRCDGARRSRHAPHRRRSAG